MNLKTAIFIWILMCLRYCVFGTITLKEINVRMENGVSRLQWTTSSELNNKLFLIERSTDCMYFNSVGTVKGEMNSVTEKQYEFSDEQPLNGISYYRITCIDIQGSKTESSVLVLDNRAPSVSSVIFPCPFTDEVNIKLESENLPDGSEVVIYGNSGRVIYSCKASPEMKLDLSFLHKGAYYVTVQDNGNRLMEKKILKNGE